MTTDPYAVPAPYAVARPRRAPRDWPAAPGWLPLAALGAGTVAALAIPGQPPGLGAVLAVGSIGVPLAVALRSRLSSGDRALVALLVPLLLMFVVRDAQWLLALDLLAIAVLGTVVLAGARTWTAVVTAGVTIWARLVPALPYLARPLFRHARAASPKARPALRGSAFAVVLVLVFGGLFASADRAFASLAAAVVPTFRPTFVTLRIVVGLFAAALVGAGLLTALAPLRTRSPRSPLARPRAEWVLPVVTLDALFAAFVAIQLAVLFGGHDHVLRTHGLTYAEYARQGFLQLVAVVLLTLLVIGVVVSRVALDDARDRLLARVSLGVLCALSFVVLASAWRRLGLYEQAYGLTRLRVFVHAVLVALGLLLALVVVAGATWRGSWLPRACIAAVAVTLLGLNAVNPDALIAHRAASTGRVDPSYLMTLSADAAPALRSLGLCVPVERPSVMGWNLARATASARHC